ncbi:MAG: hypothetical protein JWR16_2133 [Nevskia sp.]|nr:hypothetical protein [Nevskia sp.]
MLVWNARRVVEAAGIRCTIRNEFAGGASGLLSPLDTWPELWVLDERHAERAIKTLAAATAVDTERADWLCPHCSESNAGSFEICWNCGH